MAQALCPGCRDFSGSPKAVTSHLAGCSAYAQLFASGAEVPDPEALFREVAAERAPVAVARAPRAARPKVSEPRATVPAPRRTAPVVESGDSTRKPEPVFVEYWDIPQSL
jgi:hypothetical protein